MKLFTRFAALLVLGTLATASLAGPPYNIDDPGTVEFRHFSLITYYASSHTAGSEAQGTPSFLLAYGLRNNVELDLVGGVTSARTTGIGRKTGFGDLSPMVRWRFKEETKNCPQFALGYQMKIPTASASQGLGTGAMDHALWLSSAKSFKRLQAFGNVGYNFLGGSDGKNNLFYGVGLNYQTTDKLILGAQIYGNSANAPGNTDDLSWGIGAIYMYRPDQALLLQAGRSMKGYSDLNIYAGIGFTFK
ncbi:MAG TPA: hypothetical protein VKU00_04620 [Chthonomonadaceae bacterium]|nr:hypothetical protein [Chthonomonadaceae bacterium]